MYEYKVVILKDKECENILNQFAGDGWRLVAMVRDNAELYSVMVTLERARK